MEKNAELGLVGTIAIGLPPVFVVRNTSHAAAVLARLRVVVGRAFMPVGSFSFPKLIIALIPIYTRYSRLVRHTEL